MNTDPKTNPENPFLKFKARSLIIGCLLISLAVGFVLGLLAGFSGFNPRDPIFVPLIYNLTFILLSAWAIKRLRYLKLDLKRLIGQLPNRYPWFPTLGIVIAILLFSLGSGQLFYYVLSLFNPSLVEALLNEKTFYSGSETFSPVLYNILIVFTFLVVAPVTEEFLFRGILLHRWTTKWGITPALIISSILFGLLHANIVGLFVFGLMMALLYIKTRALIVPIICHSLNNLAAIALELASRSSSTTETVDTLTQLQRYWWVGIIYVALAAPWLFMFIYRSWPKQSSAMPYFTDTDAIVK
jgi:hypothetical protein